ncbi:MAG: alpha/beta fold hydrolase [Gammaproteobacteria bacterium]|nr:alpha/beta fold hydrolase [Gammaproteobacteria bacterium]
MIRKAYVDCSEGQIHYREIGESGKPVVCFFHQTASSGVMFEKVMIAMSEHYHCYSFDSPGFGQSYQPDSIPELGYLSDRLIEAITNLGIGSFHACGHHTGGSIAVEMPVRYSSKVKSLTIIGPVLVNEEEKREYMKTFVRPFTIEASGDFLKGAWEYLRMTGAGTNVDLHNREMSDHLLAHNTMPMAFSAVWKQDFQSFYQKVTCPLMIMCSKDDVLWPLFERAALARPDAKQSIVAGGDFQPDNDPDGVARGLMDFLNPIE